MRILYWSCIIVLIQASIINSQSSKLVLQTRFPDYSSEATGEYLIHPYDVVKIKDALVVSDYVDNSIKEFSADGTLIKVIATKGSGPGEVIKPYAMDFDKKNNRLYCADQGNNRFVIFSGDGQYLSSARHSAGRLRDLAADNDKIYAASFNRQDKTLLSEYTGGGQFIKNFGDFWDRRINKLKFMYQYLLYSSAELAVSQDSLYVIFEYLPIINVYCLQDYSFRQIEVKVNFVQNILKNNLHPKTVGNRVHIKDWIRGVVIDDDKLYCFALREGKMIVLDLRGNLLQTIEFAEKETTDAYAGRWFRCKEGDQFIFTDIIDGQILIYKLEDDKENNK